MIVKITTYLKSLDLLLVICYTIDNPRGERTADSDSYSPRIEKSLTNYSKYATIVNVKRRYQKESRLAARGQGKKPLDKLLKVCYTRIKKGSDTESN